jgi:hypothetical protein
MNDSYRCRLRFRVLKKLGIQANEFRFRVAGYDVVLSAQTPDQLIAEADWLVMNTREFATESEARLFGHRLKLSLDLAAAHCRFGVDTGIDVPTSALFDAFRNTLREQTGALIRDNIHGIDVFADDSDVGFLNFSATATVSAPPEPLLSDVAALHSLVDSASQEVKDIAVLLNYSLMRPEPVAQIVFSVSAVEMLGQSLGWSDDQKLLLNELAEQALTSHICSLDERREVAEAIQKGIHRISLRQGVFRLLGELGLPHLKKEWDKLYSERSALVHCLAPKPGANYSDLASRTVTLCGQILLRAIAREFNMAGERAETFYPLAQ